MGVLIAKVVSMVLLGAISMFVGILPMVFRRFCGLGDRRTSRGGQLLISALLCFGGGVILTTSFTHMLPKVNIFLKKNIENGTFPDTGLHMADVFVLCGFFLVYFCEEITHLMIERHVKPRKLPEDAGCCEDNYPSLIPPIADPEASTLQAESMVTYTAKDRVNGGAKFQPPVCIIEQMEKQEEAEVFGHCKRSSFEATSRGFLIILALSFHAIFEGIALGINETESAVWYLFIAIASHKFVIAFCVGMQFVSSGVKNIPNIIFIATFSGVSPIGAAIGILISETVTDSGSLQTLAITILQGLATGSLIYVVFFEVIEKERQKKTNGLLIVGFLFLGAVAMTIVQYIEVALSGGHH